MEKRSKKAREHWIVAGAHALGEGGWSSARVEPIAKRLGVTKGSFYWHFKDRREWLDAIVATWEERSTLAVIRHVDSAAGDPRKRLEVLWSLRDEDAGDLPVELAIRDHASRDEMTRKVVERVDKERLQYLRKNFRALGLSAADAEARSMLYYSLLIGDYFIAPAHGRFGRAGVLRRGIEFLLTAASDS